MSGDGTRNDEPTKGPYSGLPKFPGAEDNPFRLPGIGGSEIACEWCERVVPNVETYHLLTIVFLGCVVWWRIDDVLKCPRCMRSHLASRFLLAALMANVLSPILAVWWGVLYLYTLRC
jgi:hypothetical protein